MRRDHLLLIVAAAASGCDRKPPAADGAAKAAGPTVSVVRPEKRSVKRVVEQPGAVRAFEETELFAKLPGYVREIAEDPDKTGRPGHDRHIDIGSRVKAGQVLVELAIPEVVEEATQKAALVRQSEAEVEQAKKALVAAEAGVSAARA